MSDSYQRGDRVMVDGTVPAVVVSATDPEVIGVRFTYPDMADGQIYRFSPARVRPNPTAQKGV